MAWIDPPLPGRSSSSSQQKRPLPLPPLAHRSATAPSQYQGLSQSVNDLWPGSVNKNLVTHDRGAVASAWSRKLPFGTTSKALRVVRTHLSPVEDAMKLRHSTNLGEALKEATSGNKYMQTMSIVRRSRSVPAMHRHALETALASHIVRARVELRKWHFGIQEIGELRRTRDAEKLRTKLDSWKFHEDDPVVVEAHGDLKRWKYIEEKMPDVLREAIAGKDIPTIRSNLKELVDSGPSTVEGAKEAKSLLRQYEAMATVIRNAIATRCVDEMEEVLARWDFPEDDLTAAAYEMVEKRDKSLSELRKVLARERVDGSELASVLSAWAYDTSNEDFMRGTDVLHTFRKECDRLQAVLRESPVNLVKLRSSLDSWPFAMDPGSCAQLREASTVMDSFEGEVRDAIDALDGYALKQLWSVSNGGAALGELKQQLIDEGHLVQRQYGNASDEVLQLVQSSSNMEAVAGDAIVGKCEAWQFGKNDPVRTLGFLWNSCHKVVSEFNAARSYVDGTSKALWTASMLAFGVKSKSVPANDYRSHLERMAREFDAMESTRSSFESSKGFVDIRSFRFPDEQGQDLVHALGRVLQCLLTGSSSWKASGDSKESTWKGIQSVLNSKFLDCLGEVPLNLSMGIRDGAVKARAEHERTREQFGEAYSYQAFNKGEFGRSCPQLFEYLEHVFRFHDMLTDLPSCPDVEDLRGKADGEHRTMVESLKPHLLRNMSFAAVCLCCSGAAPDLDQCEKDSQVLLQKATQVLLNVQERLESVSPLENIERVGATGSKSRADADKPLMTQLDSLFNAMRDLEVADVDGLGAKYIIQAGRCFEDVPSKTTGTVKAALANFVEYLKDACIFVHGATKGKRKTKSVPRLRLTEKRISISSSTWTELPMLNVATAMWALEKAKGALAKGSALARSLDDFGTVLHKIYNDFMPLYWEMLSLKDAVDESQEAIQSVKKALHKKMVPVLTDPLPTPVTVLMQLQKLSEEGITVVAPHVESLRRGAEQETATLLTMPDLSIPSKRVGYVQRLLAAHLLPLEKVKEALKSLAWCLAKPGSMPQNAVDVIPVYELVVIVFKILGGTGAGPDDVEFAKAKQTLEDPKTLSDLLAQWDPLDASIDGLRLARSRLLRLSPLMFQSDATRAGFQLRTRVLFTWASLAVALLPCLLAAQELSPLHVSVKKVENDMKISAETTSQEQAEEAAWVELRTVFHRSARDPWRWLELIGCQDPQGFYIRHNLRIENVGFANASADSQGLAQASLSKSEDPPEVPTKSEEALPTKSEDPPEVSKRAHFKEDEYAFEEDASPQETTNLTSPQSGVGTTNLTSPISGVGTTNLTSPQSGVYSDKGFETADEVSPSKSMELEYSQQFDEPSSVNQPTAELNDTAEFDRDEAQPPVQPAVTGYSEFEEDNENVPALTRQSSGDEFEDSKDEPQALDRQVSDEFEPDDDPVKAPNRDRASTDADEFEEDESPENDKRKSSKHYDGEYEFEADEEEQKDGPPKKPDAGHEYDEFEDED